MSHLRFWLAVCAIAAALGSSLLGAFLVHRTDRARADVARERVGDQAAARLTSVMQEQQDIVSGLQGFYEASVDVNTHEFQVYARHLFGDNAIEGVAFHRVVQRADRARWERTYGLQIVDVHGKRVPNTPGVAQFYPMQFVARTVRTTTGPGFDAGTDTAKLAALAGAGALRAPRMTSPVLLSVNRRLGVLIYAPVFRRENPLSPYGYVASMITGSRLATRITPSLPAGSRMVVRDGGEQLAGQAGTGQKTSRRVAIAGRLWEIDVWTAPSVASAAPLSLAGAGVIAAVLGGIIIVLVRRRQGYTRDLLERQTEARDRAEEGLRRSEGELRTMVQEVPVGLFQTDSEGTMTSVNGEWSDITGIECEDVLGRSWASVVHPLDAELVAGWRRGIQGHGTSPVEFRILRGDDVRWVGCQLAVIPDDSGRPQAWIGFMVDITDRRESDLAVKRSEEQLRGIVAGVTDGIVATDHAGEIVWSNAAAQAMFRFDDVELATMNIVDLLDGLLDDAEAFAELVGDEDAASGDGIQRVGRSSDGASIPMRLTVRPHIIGGKEGFTVVAHDLSLKQAEEERTRQRTNEQNALRAVATLVAEQGSLASVAAAAARQAWYVLGARDAVVVRFLGPACAQIVAATSVDVPDVLRDDDEFVDVTHALDSLQCTGGASTEWDGSAWWRRDAGATAGVSVGVPIMVDGVVWGAIILAFDSHTRPEGIAGSLSPFTSLVGLAVTASDQRDQLARMATTDDLTGLANRRAFTERLTSEVARAQRYGRPLSVVMVDLDHFKNVNDTYGHAAGDRVLAEVARRVDGLARLGEVVGRVGGEEFAWIMPETDVAGGVAGAERALEALRAMPIHGVGVVTASMGVAQMRPGSSPEELLNRADQAMYAAKGAGRNRVCWDVSELGHPAGDPA